MDREQKAAVIESVAGEIAEAEAIFAIDYRGPRCRAPPSCARGCATPTRRFAVVKNSLTERAADQAGAAGLSAFLEGPTAMTFVRGDAAVAAKALTDFRRTGRRARVQGRLDERRAALRRAGRGHRPPALARRPLRPPRRHGRVAAHRPRVRARRPHRRPRPPAAADRRPGPPGRPPPPRRTRPAEEAPAQAAAAAETAPDDAPAGPTTPPAEGDTEPEDRDQED